MADSAGSGGEKQLLQACAPLIETVYGVVRVAIHSVGS